MYWSVHVFENSTAEVWSSRRTVRALKFRIPEACFSNALLKWDCFKTFLWHFSDYWDSFPSNSIPVKNDYFLFRMRIEFMSCSIKRTLRRMLCITCIILYYLHYVHYNLLFITYYDHYVNCITYIVM